jgi:surface-anchored protein
MSPNGLLKQLSLSSKRLLPSAKSKRIRSTKKRRATFEQLESRRLFVADLVDFLITEHVDINIQNSGGAWSVGPRNSDVSPEIQYANDEAVMYAGAPSLTARPAGSQYNFIGVGAGESFYLLPQSQDSDLLYLGFAAYGLTPSTVDRYSPASESKGRVASNARWVKASLMDVKHFNSDGSAGTGAFSLWQTGSFGDATVYMSSYNDGTANLDGNGLDVTDGVSSDDAMWIVAGGHAHFNFGFTKTGRYEVDLKLSTYFGDDGLNTPNTAGYSESEVITVYFSVINVGQLEVDESTYSVDESAGTVSIDVVRVGGSDGRVTVDYATANGSAQTGSDYSSRTGTLEFLDGETRKTIVIPILEDGDEETNETFTLSLSNPKPDNIHDYVTTVEGDANGILGAITLATVTIVDNDQNTAPTISPISDRFVVEGSSTGAIGFTVGDTETAAGDLVVTATSSNQAVIPNANIVLGGSGANRTINATSIIDQVGTATITVTVTDAGGAQASDTFVLTVTANGLVPFATPNLLPPGLGVAANSVVADFNSDGKLDLVTSGSGVEQLGYRQGLGGGNFSPEQGLNLESGQRSGGLNTIDYDNDGDVDFVAAEAPSSSTPSTQLVLYRNNGTATFTRVVLMSSNTTPSFFQLFPGDLNADGRVDLVYRKGASAAVYAIQQADGSFGAEVTLATSPSNAFPRLGDIDNDGDLDVVVGIHAASGAGTISVFKNDGNGSFTLSSSFNGGVSPNVLRLTDMDADGRVDIVSSTNTAGSRAGYFPQFADGTFGPRVNVMTPITALNSIEVADINGDAIPDIIAGVNLSGNVLAWSPGLGAGNYGSPILMDPAQGSSFGVFALDLDGDTHRDIISMGNLVSRPSPIVVHINKTGENPMALLPPQSLRYVNGDPLSMSVYFGFPVTVTGTPRIALQIGANTVYANYVSGSGTATLRFRYTVTSTDLDLDGIQLVSNVIDLNGGAIINPIGGAGVLEFPNVTFSGVTVNGRGALVQGITRLDPSRSTNAGSVRFQLQFAEPVTGVESSDLNVVMNAGDLSDANVLSISGSGTTYEVTVQTGTGSGTLGLGVKESADIFDLNGDVLAKGFLGGEVYTIRPDANGDINTFYTNGHSDFRSVYANGEFSQILDLDPGILPLTEYQSDSVYTYADSNALVNRPAGAAFDFLGVAAGQPLYVLPAVQNQTLPYVGWGDRIDRGVFASYLPTDSRVTSAASYVKLEMIGMRSSSDGEFSVYQIVVGPNTPRVWMATSDGISSNDAIYLSVGGHLHREVTFSKPGIYEVDVVISGFLDSNGNGTYDPVVDSYTESGIKTLVFNVDTLGARNDEFNVNGLETLRGSVTQNDKWDEGIGAYTVSLQTSTTKGTVSLQPNGSFTYQPSAMFDGSDSFTYRLTNERGGFTTATVTITGSTKPDFSAILATGHADIGVNFEDDAWDLHVHQHEPDTEYEPEEVLFYVGRDAMLTRSGDAAHAAYDFLGTSVGSTLFVLPEVENPNLLFLGIGGEELAEGVLEGDLVTLRLASVSGPGHFSIWKAGLTSTTPKQIMATSDGIDTSDAFDVIAGSHAHANFAFTKIGLYEVTFVAVGIDTEGNATDSGQVTYYFQVGNTLDALDVQNGQAQRSFLRNVDIVFGQDDRLEDLLAAGRMQITKFDLNGENGVALAATAFSASTAGNRLRIDFGVQGIGGNRNTNAGDGYYRIGIDIDGDGTIDAVKHFYRLLGDVNGDRKVDALDRASVMAAMRTTTPEADVNGDGIINSVDLTLLTRSIGKRLKNGLWIDD